MSEQAGPIRIFTLREVTQSIQRTLSARYGSSYWIQAELIKLNPYPHSGHCFPELAEKTGGNIVARMRSVLWRDDYRRINDRFRDVLGEPLKDGIKVLLQATITFDPVFGLSLHITDIDPAYTLGDLEREKRETLERLEKEGLLDRNRALGIPLVPGRIAVISVETSKGYGDFQRILEQNPWGFRFFHMLFPAVLQGTRAVETLTAQLQRISRVKKHFDLVAIIRGGGDDLGFSCYNDYRLAREIACFPLPVMTGIGHAANETVADRVAAANVITPTKMAEELIARFRSFSVAVEEARTFIHHRTERLLATEKNAFATTAGQFRRVAEGRVRLSESQLTRQSAAVVQQARFMLREAREIQLHHTRSLRKESTVLLSAGGTLLTREAAALPRATAHSTSRQTLALENIGKQIANLDPVNVLRRGYSITLVGGKAVRSSEALKAGDKVTTRLYQGSFRATVTSSETENNESHE